MLKHNRRNAWVGASAAPILVSAMLIVSMPRNAWPQCIPQPDGVACPGSVCESDDPNHTTPDAAILGWDGDRDAVYAHMDGSYRVRDGKSTTIRWGIYNDPTIP